MSRQRTRAGFAYLAWAVGFVGCGSEVAVSSPTDCGPSFCGACAPGCVAVDQCVDGQWVCECDCTGTCGPDECAACPLDCQPANSCIDGQWLCSCECPTCAPTPCPSCAPPCQPNGHCEGTLWVCDCVCPPTVGEQVSPITELTVSINLADGFMEPARDDVYRIDVASGLVVLNDTTSVSASSDQMAALVGLVASLSFREQTDCINLAIDGAPWPPTITASNETTSFTFSVSDLSCAESDHSASGNVVPCVGYQQITQALLEMFPEQGPYGCESYW